MDSALAPGVRIAGAGHLGVLVDGPVISNQCFVTHDVVVGSSRSGGLDGVTILIDVPADVVSAGSQIGDVAGLVTVAAVVDDSIHQVGIECTCVLIPGIVVGQYLGIAHRCTGPLIVGAVVVVIGTPQVQGGGHIGVVRQDIERVVIRRVELDSIQDGINSAGVAVIGHRHGVGAGSSSAEGGIGATGMISAIGVKHLIFIVGAGIEVHFSRSPGVGAIVVVGHQC